MKLKIILVFLFVFVSLSVLFVEWDSGSGSKLLIKNARGEEVIVEVYIADNRSERRRGLMGWESLDRNKGMLFVFDDSGNRGFWMENTSISLSIAFIDSDGIIVDIRNMEPNSEVIYSPNEKYMYALEVNQGFYENHYVEEGNKVQVKGI